MLKRSIVRLAAIVVLSIALAPAAWARLDFGTFVATGPTHIVHNDHALTLLANGKVLITGDGAAEVYDPATGTWTTTGALSGARSGHTATRLPSGKVLVTGGVNQGPTAVTATTQVYDPATGIWTAGPSLSSPRAMHTASLLANGKVLIAGGTSVAGDLTSAQTSADLYDPAANTITPTGSFTGKRAGHRSIALANGKVLICGGAADASTTIATSNLYDPATGMWTPTGAMNHDRQGFGIVTLANGKVLVAGGQSSTLGVTATAETYDPASGVWTNAASMSLGRAHHALVRLVDGQVLAFGNSATNANRGEIYDPSQNAWKPSAYSIAKHDYQAWGDPAITLASGAILFPPGQNGSVTELYRATLPRSRTDFNGDFRSDIVFENGVGTRWLYTMNGAAVAGTAPLPAPATGWTLAGIGDFDANGSADLLFVNTANPTQHWIWLMSGATIIGGGSLGVAPGYRATFIADFDGDGRADIVWENAAGSRWAFRMNGVSVVASFPLPGTAPGWELVGVGNFDGANGADLLWMNTASPGAYWIYLLNGPGMIGGGSLAVAPGYLPMWIGDMDRDGKADIVWENGTSSRWVYTMSGAAVTAARALPVPVAGWSLVGVGDFDNSQGLDLVWQNSASPTQYWIYLLSMSGALLGGAGVMVAPGYVPLTHPLGRLSSGWTGHISCVKRVTSGTSVTGQPCAAVSPVEVHDWYVGGPQVGTAIPTFYTATGSWCGGQWSINKASTVSMTFTTPSNLPSFDRTSGFISMPYAGLPQVVFHEFDFLSIQGPAFSTSFSNSRTDPLLPGDTPTIASLQGTVSCSWSFGLQ